MRRSGILFAFMVVVGAGGVVMAQDQADQPVPIVPDEAELRRLAEAEAWRLSTGAAAIAKLAKLSQQMNASEPESSFDAATAAAVTSWVGISGTGPSNGAQVEALTAKIINTTSGRPAPAVEWSNSCGEPSNNACYRPSTHTIYLPDKFRTSSASCQRNVLFHEYTHALAGTKDHVDHGDCNPLDPTIAACITGLTCALGSSTGDDCGHPCP